MNLPELFLAHYGWQGAALAALLFVLLCVQLRYGFVYGRVAGYRNDRLRPVREQTPPVSVIVPMFTEEYAFVEERLPLLLAQEYEHFEVVIVYVGRDGDFFDDLLRIRQSFPQVVATKIEQDPRFPISLKMALNVGIKSAHYECLLITSTDARPVSQRWIALMAKGFSRGDVVLGYCGLEGRGGAAGWWMRTDRFFRSVQWLARAVARRPYRGLRCNMGFTRTLYFAARGFNHLNMNIGEDDLFLQKILTPDNVSVVLSPRAALRQQAWGGLGWWSGQRRLRDAALPFYPSGVRAYLRGERLSRVGFFATAAVACVVMPPEYKLAVAALVVVRYAVVLRTVWRLTRRLGERGLRGAYFLYDLLSPWYDACVALLRLRKDERVWR